MPCLGVTHKPFYIILCFIHINSAPLAYRSVPEITSDMSDVISVSTHGTILPVLHLCMMFHLSDITTSEEPKSLHIISSMDILLWKYILKTIDTYKYT